MAVDVFSLGDDDDLDDAGDVLSMVEVTDDGDDNDELAAALQPPALPVPDYSAPTPIKGRFVSPRPLVYKRASEERKGSQSAGDDDLLSLYK